MILAKIMKPVQKSCLAQKPVHGQLFFSHFSEKLSKIF